MKKTILTLSFVAILASCSSFSDLLGEETSFSEEQATSFVNFFLNPIKMESDIHFSYYGEDVLFHTVDQIAPTRRHLRMTAKSGETEVLIGETSVYGLNDEAYSESLSLANTVESEAILDSDDNPVSYEENYAPWFKLPSSYSASSFSKYFAVSSSSNGYEVTLTDIGAGILLPRLEAYLPSIDSFIYEAGSYRETFENFVIDCGTDGVPLSMSFRLIYSDRYGGTYQDYETTLSSIEEAVGITPYVPTSTEEERTELNALLAEMKEKLETGNFTTHTQYLQDDGEGRQQATSIEYSCYYELDSTPATGGHYPLMLSDYELEADGYGLTLAGLYYWADDGVVCQTGISPESDFIEPMNSNTYSDIPSCIPAVYGVSADFYTKNADGSFSFDLSSVDFDTYYFSYSLLEEVLGIGDYIGISSGIMMSGSYAFDFEELKLYKEGENYVAELRANSQMVSGTYLTAKVTFSDFGTTSLEAVDNETIAACLEVVKNYESTL